jgi:hypothetical protein
VTAPDPGHLANNVAYFARALRAAGVPVGPGAVLDALRALELTGLEGRTELYWTLHAVFVNRHDHSVLFDQAFNLFWRKRAFVEKLIAMMSPAVPARPNAPPPASRRIDEAMFAHIGERQPPLEKPQIEVDAKLTLSDREILQKKDFAQMSAAEVAEARREIAKLKLPIADRPVRRRTPDPKGRSIDLRRTLRRAFATGGEPIGLARRGPGEKPPPVVALLDISGSMTEYTRLFLTFLHAATENRRQVSSFLFGTRLTNITRQLRHKDPDEALAAASAHVKDWAGGTRIATALHLFNRHWSRRVLAQGAIVLLITDGLERDPDDRLTFEMDRLHRSCRRLIWLNPLLRFEGFEAKAKGIRTMLPHVDEFRPIHNLAAMKDLCAALARPADPSTDPQRWLKRLS